MPRKKSVIKVRQQGTVKWFDDLKGYGFITPLDGSDDVFVHQSEIYCPGKFRTLHENERVEYDVEVYEGNRIKAVKVTGPQNVAVTGGTDPRPEAQAAARGQKVPSRIPPPQLPPPQMNGFATHAAAPRMNGINGITHSHAPAAYNPASYGVAPLSNGLPQPTFNPLIAQQLAAAQVPGYGRGALFQQAATGTGFSPYQLTSVMQQLRTLPTPEQYAIYYQQQMQIRASAAAAAAAAQAALQTNPPPGQSQITDPAHLVGHVTNGLTAAAMFHRYGGNPIPPTYPNMQQQPHTNGVMPPMELPGASGQSPAVKAEEAARPASIKSPPEQPRSALMEAIEKTELVANNRI